MDTTTDETRVTDEEIAAAVANSRQYPRLRTSQDLEPVIVALADRLAAREAERAEMVALLALLEDVDCAIDCDVLQFGRDGDCALLPEKTCWGHRRIALLAKLRGTP